MPVFKRRRPDDPHGAESGATLPAGLSTSDSAVGNDRPGNPAEPFDNGLGVPPFRPAPPQEVQTMSRPPFSTTPTPPATPPATTARPALGPIRTPTRDPAERRTLVVGRGISVQGTVQDAERLVVEGTVEASMIHAHELAISPGGVFKGEVEVEDAEIAGTIDGTLTARGSLIVRSTGKVMGTARCRRLQVEDGGQITGQMEMLSGDSAPRAEPTPARSVAEPATYNS
ncbi:MAG TPA: polymer-forming cytoskeletal protein [Acetobacteraceae bacterium]|nr:polymer-forming cytoskeletal protein [Acetobacteraceae bacterium]